MSYAVKKGTFAANTSTGDQTVDTGTGVEMKALLLWGTLQTAESLTTNSYGFIGWAASSSEQATNGWAIDDATTTTNCGGGYFTDACVVLYANGDPTQDAKAAFVSFGTGGDAGKFTINWSDAPAAAVIVHYMTLGGTDITNVGVNHYVAKSGAPGERDDTGVGFQPDLVMFMSRSVVATGAGVDARFTLGAATSASAQAAYFFDDEDGVVFISDHNRTWNFPTDALVFIAVAGDIPDGTAKLVSFQPDGWRLDWTAIPVGDTAYLYSALSIKGGSYVCTPTPAAGTPSPQVFSTSFQPAGVFCFGNAVPPAFDAAGPENVSSSIGGSDGVSEGLTWNGSRGGEPLPNMAHMRTNTTKVWGDYYHDDGAIEVEGDLTAFNASDFSITWAGEFFGTTKRLTSVAFGASTDVTMTYQISDKLTLYLQATYVPGTFASADLHTLINHHLSTLTGVYTQRWLDMLASAEAFI